MFKQITDLRDAITFAESQPEFDSEQGFGVWGSSFSGGLAIVTAANDPRVRCVVAQIPNVSGHRNAVKLFTAEQLHEIRRRAATDRVARLAGEPPMTVPMFSEDPDELCAFPGQFPEEYREAIESGIWNNQTTLRSLENFIEFEPAGWLPYVAPKPLLMIIAERRSMHLHRGSDERSTKPLRDRRSWSPTTAATSMPTQRFSSRPATPARDWFVEHLGFAKRQRQAAPEPVSEARHKE